MASRDLTVRDIVPKRPRKTTIQASASLKGLITLRVKNIPETQILQSFERAINRASQKIAVDLMIALDEAMRSNIWQTTDGKEDIIDTGKLLESGSVTVTSNGLTIAYDEPYAALVHYGGYIVPYGNSTTRVYLPARPWVDSVLNGIGPIKEFDFEKYYRKEIDAEFSQ